ncbi:hypothetical protein MNB_SM-4-1797 [hydrothermal vent metagenome]|uniref:Lipoprotein SmpA/OmlA domain-containing protein n=1 Tax=hydrothermal vent metagenome TaxID=652676 RepID=A0A1W1CA87_9ZZZZ
MKKIISILAITLATLFIGCGSAKLSPAQQALIDNQTLLYTQVGMWRENGKIVGTNYATGMHIPVNSEVKILAVNAKIITIEIDGAKINYEVFTKYTQVDATTMISRLFSMKKVSLEALSPATKENVLNGAVAMGMTKSTVLLSRGYPPFHATRGIESNKWKYWRNRWVTAYVTFKDDKVVKIDGAVS